MSHGIKKYVSFRDATANDISKAIAGDVGESAWQLLFANVVYVSNANAGNRLLTITLADADANEVISINAPGVQIASKTYHYKLLQGITRETLSTVAPASVDGIIQMPIPADFIVPAGYSLTIEDLTAVSATDDMTISGMIAVLR